MKIATTTRSAAVTTPQISAFDELPGRCLFRPGIGTPLHLKLCVRLSRYRQPVVLYLGGFPIRVHYGVGFAIGIQSMPNLLPVGRDPG